MLPIQDLMTFDPLLDLVHPHLKGLHFLGLLKQIYVEFEMEFDYLFTIRLLKAVKLHAFDKVRVFS